MNKPVREITVHELKKMIDENHDFQLIDVREDFEKEIADIGGDLIPLRELRNNLDKISREKKVILYCRSGKRSANAVQILQDEYGYENLYNLKGSVLAWSDEIDPEVQKY